MSETISIMFDENGIAKEYDDTFDISIHCESEEEQNKVLEILNRRWIPVSERVPEDTYPVNITWVNHAPEPYYATIKDKPFTATGCYCDGMPRQHRVNQPDRTRYVHNFGLMLASCLP